MPTNIQGQQVLRATRGFLVQRPAAALPSTTIQTIFNVNGGRVLLVHLGGIVVTLLSGTNSTTVGITPTLSGGASAPAILSSAGIIPVLAGSPFVSKLDGGAMLVTVNGGLTAAAPYLTIPGAITITTGSTTTGTCTWECVYIPFDAGASVTAA